MAFDGFATCSIVGELKEALVDGKINKIFEPNKNEIILGIYNKGQNYALNISICSDNYRINLTTHSKPNPINAPGFCMLLRKYLIGGKISNIYTEGLERIVTIEIESYNELNDLVVNKLIIELMGKHSNVILVNKSNVIIDSLRHLDSSSNSIRDILPARYYELPGASKENFLKVENLGQFYSQTSQITSLDEGISGLYTGISKLFVQSIISELGISNEPSKQNLEKIFNYLKQCLEFGNVHFKNYNSDYSITLENKDSKTLNEFIDEYYTNKENDIEFTNYRNSILKLVQGTLKKITKRIYNINEKIKECQDKDKYRLYGELITANLYKLNGLDTDYIELEDYYSGDIKKIPVNKNVSPAVNAKNYYKKYNKLKNALEVVNLQKKEAMQDIKYIESVIYSLDNARTIADIDEIYSEISENELFFSRKFSNAKTVKKTNKKNKKLNKKDMHEYNPIEYKIENYTFLIGKNNKQNDYLSTKILRGKDMWFHVKDITSSHGILLTNNTEPSIDVIIRCAQIVAYYSKARQSSNVPVDYALGQFVKKPSGAKPGMVIYTHNYTVNVQPKK